MTMRTFTGVVRRHRRGSTASNHLWPSNSSRSAGPNFLRSAFSFFSSIILSSRSTVICWNRSSSASRSTTSLWVCHLFGHVAGGGGHAKYLAGSVAVDGGVVQDFGERLVPVPVAQGQWGGPRPSAR